MEHLKGKQITDTSSVLLRHIGAPGYLVTNLVKHLVTNLVIHWILWSIWWQYWWHILWGTKFVTIFGENFITLFGDSLKLSPYLVTFLSHNLSLNQFTKFFTIYFTNYFPIFRDNSVTISVLTNFSQNNQYICHNNWWFIKLVTQLLTQFNAFGVKIIVIISQSYVILCIICSSTQCHIDFHHKGKCNEDFLVKKLGCLLSSFAPS